MARLAAHEQGGEFGEHTTFEHCLVRIGANNPEGNRTDSFANHNFKDLQDLSKLFCGPHTHLIFSRPVLPWHFYPWPIKGRWTATRTLLTSSQSSASPATAMGEGVAFLILNRASRPPAPDPDLQLPSRLFQAAEHGNATFGV